jgi:hypothetical protein
VIPLVRPGQQAAKIAPASFKLCILRHMQEGRDRAARYMPVERLPDMSVTVRRECGNSSCLGADCSLFPLPQNLFCGAPMTEEKKHAILFVTTLLCARKIIDLVDSNTLERMGKKHWLGVFENETIDQVI